MARILLLLAIVLGIFWWLRDRAGARQADTRARQSPGATPRQSESRDGTEPMVQCAQCGVHLPRGDAIAWQGLHYCRRSHLPDATEQGGGRS